MERARLQARAKAEDVSRERQKRALKERRVAEAEKRANEARLREEEERVKERKEREALEWGEEKARGRAERVGSIEGGC